MIPVILKCKSNFALWGEPGNRWPGYDCDKVACYIYIHIGTIMQPGLPHILKTVAVVEHLEQYLTITIHLK